MLWKRDDVVQALGWTDWQEATRATAHLSQAAAAEALGVARPTIHDWRAELGLETSSPAISAEARAEKFRSDQTDKRHGTANGYRNLKCRCSRCTAAWTEYLRARKVAAR